MVKLNLVQLVFRKGRVKDVNNHEDILSDVDGQLVHRKQLLVETVFVLLTVSAP